MSYNRFAICILTKWWSRYFCVSHASYAKMQDGKRNMQLRTEKNGWNADQKAQANEAYKDCVPALHRPGSPDVFPGF